MFRCLSTSRLTLTGSQRRREPATYADSGTVADSAGEGARAPQTGQPLYGV
jgi:hypothetical protein